MRRITIGSRWTRANGRYKGGWRHNPWINAIYGASQGRETDGGSIASVDEETAAHPEIPVPAGLDNSNCDDDTRDPEQKAATKDWENEGGRLGTHPPVGQ